MDKSTRSLIEYLLVRYLDGKATPAEEEQLFTLVDRYRDDETMEEIQQTIIAATEPETNFQETWEPMIGEILTADAANTNKQSKVVPFYRRWTSIAAAAVILLVAGVWFYAQNNNQQPQNIASLTQQQRYKNDVPPGKTGAILKLSNGKEILLDTARNGTLVNGFTKDAAALTITASDVQFATVTTPKARTQSITLSDGTNVWLNAGSSITFPTAFTGNTREIKMTGEVYFEVAKNAAKPFIAQTPTDKIEVLGTHFNINAYGAVKTTLLEGSVKIGNSTLKPGEQFSKGKIEQPDLEEVMAWKNGMFRYNNTNIREIMEQVERWYDVEVKYEGNTNLLDFTGGVERSADVSALLKKLELTGLVKFYIDEKTITVRPE